MASSIHWTFTGQQALANRLLQKSLEISVIILLPYCLSIAWVSLPCRTELLCLLQAQFQEKIVLEAKPSLDCTSILLTDATILLLL